jgi:hypothetical protein
LNGAFGSRFVYPLASSVSRISSRGTTTEREAARVLPANAGIEAGEQDAQQKPPLPLSSAKADDPVFQSISD